MKMRLIIEAEMPEEAGKALLNRQCGQTVSITHTEQVWVGQWIYNVVGYGKWEAIKEEE